MTTIPSFTAYRALAAKEPAQLVTLGADDLADGDLLVQVRYSTLNYKDGLAILGKPGVVRSFPLTCGIDLAGDVVDDAAGFTAGQQVVLTGAGLSETRDGGYSGYQRVDAAAVLPVPVQLGLWGSMAVGTGGLTAMLCVLRLEAAGVSPDQGPVLVTGATGGVGSFAVSILSRLGYEVHASTGKADEHDYLRELGASEIVERDTLTGEPRPLAKERWAAAVDSVGGVTLANILPQIRYSGAVAACGLAGGPGLATTVMPFILRNVALLGVDSVNAPIELRRAAWARLDEALTVDELQRVAVNAGFDEIPALAAKILDGQIRGRVVIEV
ncbi:MULTISPECIES: MDR family oxidoreductase [unclassified Gordonia (in: high G+C Gram-positive bacteria)]|uniref:MDR family oxidoreductase n=1 Tax=unclassified Gordonia (in: high G+C Gram-positive bacteria) TaxID=2657482 RepID=UPI001F0F6078|nr:MDR family oxidoreductase [Gordonia sp. ABSL49_1]MCH5641167.1 oxidoreductase [Gordonia sp. ABSL49_1]